MSNFSVVLAVAFLVATSAVADSSVRQSLVVIENITIAAEAGKGGAVDFFVAQVVTVLKTKGQSVLVQNDFREKAWLPRSALADASSFQPISTWPSETTFEVSSASGDSGQTYYFKRDGTFRANYDDNHEPRKWSGRLFRNGEVIWAKPKQRAAGFSGWAVFRQVPNGKLCTLNFDTPLGCECVGTYNSAFAVSCKQSRWK